MSDHEHELPDQVQAVVRDDLAAFRPDRTPPFAALQARKRRRDMRRRGAALAATALAVAGAAFVPSALTGGASPTPEQMATADQAYFTFVIRYADEAAFAQSDEAVKDCLKDPSVVRSTTRFSMPPLLSGLLRGEGARDRLFRCVSENAAGATVETAAANQQETPLLSPYTLSPDGRTLTVTATVGGCDATGTASATAIESADRVEVRALVARPPVGTAERAGPYCPTDLVTQQVQVQLDAPLGNREVFDATTGEQVTGPRMPGLSVDPADDTRYGFSVTWTTNPGSYNDEAEVAVQRCFGKPGVEFGGTLTSRPPIHSGKVVGRTAADALKACVKQAAPASTFTLVPPAPTKTGAASPTPSATSGDDSDGVVKAGPTVRLKETDEFGLVVRAGRRGDAVVVDVDRVDSLSGQEAEDAAAARGTDVSNDHFEVNDSPRARQYVLADDPQIWKSNPSDVGDPPTMTVAEWIAYVTSERGKAAMFHFDIEDGRVVGIEEQYFP